MKVTKDSVFLPTTTFPMKGNLPILEPELLQYWQDIDLFGQLRSLSKGREPFTLHDGPPYANGHLHIGHALNKILKDIINRCQQMSGKDAHYVPGWDCHGLPIEWKIEEQFREKGQDKDSVPIQEFRSLCREFAAKWIEIQKEEFKRLGVLGNWDRPYTTMAFPAEAIIAGELGKALLNGSLYQGAKPVLWSVVEKTALAEAEVEYFDHTSVTIWVKFPIVKTTNTALDNAKILIWTTTPWTIPGNRAISFGADIDYALVEVTEIGEAALCRPGERFILAKALIETVAKASDCRFSLIQVVKADDLHGVICNHPLKHHPDADQGYDFSVPLLAGEHVTDDAGTGFVHTAPGHGEEDWHVAVTNNIPVPDTVQADGTYYPHVALFAGLSVLAKGSGDKYYSPVAKPMVDALKQCGMLLSSSKIIHSYPHSWRSKAPLIYRNTPQWFIAMDKNGLRDTALKAIDETKWIPSIAMNRLRSMVVNRPDWCVSRQRAWGVPLAVFVDKRTGEPLRDPAIVTRITAAFKEEGCDCWFTSPASRFLGESYNPEHYRQVFDILDVWFDSGSTHAFVLEQGEWGLASPASLYLEGSDQHRGWFQSSLLESCLTRGQAPYKAVLSHGFVLDEKGLKMSKSLGNVVSPQDICNSMGADILRLWVIGSDSSEDLRIGREIMKTHVDIYRRLRNTMRYLLGALSAFDSSEIVEHAAMPELEKWVLYRLHQLEQARLDANETYQYQSWFKAVYEFCAGDLSAFYFDIRKDSLYCDSVTNLKRRAARTVFSLLFDYLSRWLAPFIPFTAEEAWLARFDRGSSVHLQDFMAVPTLWDQSYLGLKWDGIRTVRGHVTEFLERMRERKIIGSSLQAHIIVKLTKPWFEMMKDVDLAEIAIVSALEIECIDVPDGEEQIMVEMAPLRGEKCERCWRVLEEVDDNEALCNRCLDVIGETHETI